VNSGVEFKTWDWDTIYQLSPNGTLVNKNTGQNLGIWQTTDTGLDLTIISNNNVVGIARYAYIDWVADGTLYQVFDWNAPHTGAYWFVCTSPLGAFGELNTSGQVDRDLNRSPLPFSSYWSNPYNNLYNSVTKIPEKGVGDPIDSGTGQQTQNIPVNVLFGGQPLPLNYVVSLSSGKATFDLDEYFRKSGSIYQYFKGNNTLGRFTFNNAGKYTPDNEASRTLNGYIVETNTGITYLFCNEEKQYTYSPTDSKFILSKWIKNGQALNLVNGQYVDQATGAALTATLSSLTTPTGTGIIADDFTLSSADGTNYQITATGSSYTFSANGLTLYTDVVNSNGQVTKQTDALGANSFLAYTTGITQVTTYTDRRNNNWLSEYHNQNLLAKQSPLGNIIEYGYDIHNRKISETNESGNITLFGYGVYGQLISITDPKGNRLLAEYNDALYTTKLTDREGNATTITRDATNLVTTTTNALNFSKAYTYNTNGQVVTETDELGNVTTNTYANGRLTLKTFPSGKTIAYTYNTSGLLTSISNNGNTVTINTYDGMGRPTKITSARGAVTQASYNFRGQITSTTTPLNAASQFLYNGNGYITKITNPDTAFVSFGYDPEDNQTTITDEIGYTTNLAYDADNQLISIADADGVTMSFARTPTGKPVTIKNSQGQVVQSFTYDANDNVTGVTNAANATTTVTYDKEDRVKVTTYPDGKTLMVQRDVLGRPIAITKAARTITPSYTATGLLTSISLNGTTPITLQYDQDGIKTLEKTAGNKQITRNISPNWLPRLVSFGNTHLNYDNDNNLSSLSDTVGTITYTNDLLGRVTGTSELRSGITKTSSTTYNWRGQPTSYTDWNGAIVGYVYNLRGDKTKVTYPGNKNVIYTYTPAGRLQTVTDWNNNVTTYTYDTEGRLATKVRPNGITEYRSYDLNNRATQIRQLQGTTIITSLDIEYNSIGKITKETYFPAPTGTLDTNGNPTVVLEKVYSYLDTGELAGVSINGAAFLYTSDNRANPTTLGITSNQTWLANRTEAIVVSVDNEATNSNGISITRNPQGTMTLGPTGVTSTSVTSKPFAVNARQQITLSSRTYDSRGELVAKTGITYLVDAYNNRLRKIDASGTTYYIYGDGLEYAITPTGNEYYHYDNRGSTCTKTNATGLVIGNWTYDPYGVVLSGPLTTEYLFLGKYGCTVESDLGLYKVGARYYAPNLRQFMSMDGVIGSLTEPNSLNRYVYCMGDPVNFVDPSGLCPNSLLEQKAGRWVIDMYGLHPRVVIAHPNSSTGYIGIEYQMYLPKRKTTELSEIPSYAVRLVSLGLMVAAGIGTGPGQINIIDVAKPTEGEYHETTIVANAVLLDWANEMRTKPMIYQGFFYNCRHFGVIAATVGEDNIKSPTIHGIPTPIYPSVKNLYEP